MEASTLLVIPSGAGAHATGAPTRAVFA